MFTVIGQLNDGHDYAVTWADGDLHGDGGAVATIVARVGDEVSLTPTGPRLEVALDDPLSVLAVMHESGTVTAVGGQPPERPASAMPEDATP